MAEIGYREIPPSPRLGPLVESFWTLDCPDAEGPPQRVVPDGRPELILNLGEPYHHLDGGIWRRQPRYFLAGQLRGPIWLRPGGATRILGVRFTPHGAAALLGAPMHELSERFTSLDDLSPALGRALENALDSANAVRAVDNALARAFAGRTTDLAMAAAVQHITASRGVLRLSGLACDLNLSRRQFERRFHAAVGLSPKMFSSLQRFVQVLRAVGKEAHRWPDTAVDCGYYDQAHLIRDFKRFAGETPGVLLAPEADLARHFYSRFGMSHSSNTPRRRVL